MNITPHLPALQVVIPLLSAPLAILMRRANTAFLIVTAASWAAFAIAISLWLDTADGTVISYAIGSWEPPWGIEYHVDRLSGFVLLLVTGMAAISLPYSRASIEAEIPPEQHYIFYAMFALCLTGLLGITITGDAFNIFVFLEIASLSSYVLIALGRDRRALMAAYQYLLIGTIGATFIVIGIGLLYLMTGTLNLADMATRLPQLGEARPVLAALAFLTVGISLKLALFPLHQWLPNAYTYAPSVVSAFLAATATKVSVYLLIRFYYSVFGASLVFEQLPLPEIMLLLSLAAMFAASAIAIFQNNLKRLFAYSSVAQIGYITLGISLESINGLTASILHLFNHAITKGALFLLIGSAVAVTGGATLSRLSGLARIMPLTSFGIVLGGLSLIGIPGTVGFISKWYLLLAALEKGQWWLALAIVASSLLAVAYVWRFIEVAYFRSPPADLATRREAPLALLMPAWMLILATVYFGLETSVTVGSAASAAANAAGCSKMTAPMLILAALAIPMVGSAAIALCSRQPNLREAVTLISSALLFICVASLLPSILASARPEVQLLEPLPGLPIVFSVEPLGMLFALIASGLWIINSIYSIGYLRGNNESNQTRFYVCFALALGAAIGIAFAGNLITLFVFYEILTLITYPLVTHHGTDKAKQGGRTYLAFLIGTSVMFLLPAIVFTWYVAGTTDFRPGGILAGHLAPASLAVLLALYMFGIGKAALMPFHRWLPAAMVAPTPVSALLHAVAVVKAGVFTVVKVIVYIFGTKMLAAASSTDWLIGVAGFTIIAASVVAIYADNLKRRLAYSTVSQLSYVVLAAALLTPLSITGAALHIATHAIAKITLFFAAGAIYTAARKTEVSQLDGIGRRMPWTMTAFSVAALSLIGIPPAAGFISKWFILTSAVQGEHYLVVVVLIVSTLLNAGYFLPIIYSAFFKVPGSDDAAHPHGEAPLPMVVALLTTAGGTIALFFFSTPLLQLVQRLVATDF